MDILKEAVSDVYCGHVVVSATRTVLTAIELPPVHKGVTLRAPGSTDITPNTAPVWVGGSGVTADSDAGTGGMPICPGESIFIPTEKLNKLWVISTIADQDLAWMAL